MMKFLLLAALSTLAISANGAYIQESSKQEGTLVVSTLSTVDILRRTDVERAAERSYSSNINVGVIGDGDRQLFGGRFSNSGSSNSQLFSISYTSLPQNTITAIRFSEVGASQHARVGIISGGIGSNNVTIRVITERGYGFNYALNVWGY